MLRLRFLNVADGDAILIEEIAPGRAFRMLVDAGGALPAAPGLSCAAHLRRLRITRLDRIAITHLHADHIGGLTELIGQTRAAELLSGYMPLPPGGQIPPEPKADKAVRGMIGCLNQFSQDAKTLLDAGTRLNELFASHLNVRLTEALSADFIVPSVPALRFQREIWNSMLDGKRVPDGKKLRAAKLRNPNSLRIRLRYAGRAIELPGDCYAEIWEKEDLAPCDILKAPHHGDAKAVTDLLLAKLRPRHAVISCSRDQTDRDRPAPATVHTLNKGGARIHYTDAQRPSVDFTILENGQIVVPD